MRKDMTSKLLMAGLVAGCTFGASAGSVDSVLFDLASNSGQVNVPANYRFNIFDDDTSVTIADLDASGGLSAGDTITTDFVISSITTTGANATLDSGSNADLGGGNFATTVGMFGTSVFEVTGVDFGAGTIDVIASPDTDPLFTIFEDDDAADFLDPTTLTLPGTTLFGTVGNPPSPGNELQLIVQSTDQSSADLTVLDFFAAAGGSTTFQSDLIQPSNSTITADDTGETGESANAVITVTATVVPSPVSAGVGAIGLLGLVTRRRRNSAK